MLKYVFISSDLDELNKRAGISSLPPRHYDRKLGNIYGDWTYRHSWSTLKGTIINTTLLCPLVEGYTCPCEAKIVEMPGQFILHIHAEHTAANHATDHAKFLIEDKQDLIRNTVKTVPMNTTSELIKNVQDSPTKKIDPKLKESVARLIRHERAKLLTIVCDGEKLTSDIGSLKTLCRQNLHQGRNTGTHTLPVHSCATMYRLLQDILHWQRPLSKRLDPSDDRLLQHLQPTQYDPMHR